LLNVTRSSTPSRIATSRCGAGGVCGWGADGGITLFCRQSRANAPHGADPRRVHPGRIGAAPEDISDAILFLVSDEARYITGVPLSADAGALIK
jgi:NAD(P)-dependent dehydrogenase (short-subunit alcohol dehydrogenase family)